MHDCSGRRDNGITWSYDLNELSRYSQPSTLPSFSVAYTTGFHIASGVFTLGSLSTLRCFFEYSHRQVFGGWWDGSATWYHYKWHASWQVQVGVLVVRPVIRLILLIGSQDFEKTYSPLAPEESTSHERQDTSIYGPCALMTWSEMVSPDKTRPATRVYLVMDITS